MQTDSWILMQILFVSIPYVHVKFSSKTIFLLVSL
jgi:hypothetical protein